MAKMYVDIWLVLASGPDISKPVAKFSVSRKIQDFIRFL